MIHLRFRLLGHCFEGFAGPGTRGGVPREAGSAPAGAQQVTTQLVVRRITVVVAEMTKSSECRNGGNQPRRRRGYLFRESESESSSPLMAVCRSSTLLSASFRSFLTVVVSASEISICFSSSFFLECASVSLCCRFAYSSFRSRNCR